MRILVVDDDPIILELLPLILHRDGHDDVVTAASGQAALDILSYSEDPFDVLLLDIAMPGMDGVTLCGKIRELNIYRSAPIIMLTAKSDPHSIESAFGAGATDYITKPFDLKGIGARIQIAERMMREVCKSYTLEAHLPVSPILMGTHEFDINDPVRICGLDHHTDPFSLGNYLSQLARKKVDATSVYATQIHAFPALYEGCSTQELLLTISEVSAAMSSAAEKKHLLNAYTGSGIFMCISTDEVLTKWTEMEQLACDYLKNSEVLKSANLGVDISVSIGRPFRPNASKTQRVRPTFDRAISLLEKRMYAAAKAG